LDLTELSAFTKYGRELLQCNDAPTRLHRDFERWVNKVAEWLDTISPNSGLSAEWSSLPTSELVVGNHYYPLSDGARDFCRTVRLRLQWLSKIPTRLSDEIRQQPGSIDSSRVFVVHGHDNEMKESVARIISKLGLDPIILHEQASKGRTVIEKFEQNAEVGFAVVLLSPDDYAYPKSKNQETAKLRARQNVVLELGYFVGRIGRNRVLALKRGDIELPSDLVGLVYTSYDDAGHWKVELVRELKECGYNVDANAIV